MIGSTALGESTDPEALRALLARYFERMNSIVESHGGTVEKFIGDAVMAVFGVPMAHEDDALRAVRAAAEMRDALPGLGVQARIGLNTGEVVTGTEERLATGDAVNVAARLEQAARPGEVLLGAETMQLVEEAVEGEPVEPLALKGKRDSVSAFRLGRVGEAPERAHGELFAGRERELDAIAAAWGRAADQRCELVTIVAEAGVGKTRLAAEALGRIEARVVRGRCLSYGEGITYWPVVEVVKQLAARPSHPAAAAAITSLLGRNEAATSAEEIAWAFRKLLEEQAPIVCLFEDIHRGEETFLDLLEHVALLTAGAQVLLLCTARPELLERRPSWPVTMRLAPLEQADVALLVPASLPTELREQITAAAGGNPLFVTEMVAMALATDGEVMVPPTLRALLTARLDQVEAAERRVLERGAVEGEIFHRGAVQALAADEPQVTARLAALVRRELVRPEPAQIPGEDGFRFRHLLIRDAAYEALPKSARADLHERFADWLEEHGQALVELDEVLGYHLERAFGYKAELGHPDPALAENAGERLAAAGRRALWRDDNRTAAVLFERALALIRPLRLDVNLELDLAEAQRVPQEKAAIAERAAKRAQEIGDRAGEALARTVLARTHLEFSSESVAVDDLERLARETLTLLEKGQDAAASGRAWYALSEAANYRGRFEERALAAEQALQCFERAGAHHFELAGLPWALVYGPRPADQALETLDSFLERNPSPYGHLCRAQLLAMLDRFEEAWETAVAVAARLREVSGRADVDLALGEMAALAGEHELGAPHLQRGCDILKRLGQEAELSTYAPQLARSLCELGRYELAEPLAQLGHDLADERDLTAQAWWRLAQARIHAYRDEQSEAERLVREAVAILGQTDALNMQGDAYTDLADVLSQGGDSREAQAALAKAMVCYQRKKNLTRVAQVRPRLEALADD